MSDAILQDIIELVADEANITINEDIFAGYFPRSSKDLCSFIKDTPGDQVYFADPTVTDRMNYQIRIITRGPDYIQARRESYKIYRTLVPAAGIKFPPVEVEGDDEDRIILSSEGNLPADIGQDSKGRWEFSTNITLRIAENT